MLIVGQALLLGVSSRNPTDLVSWAVDALGSFAGVRVGWAGSARSAALSFSKSTWKAWFADWGITVERVCTLWTDFTCAVIKFPGTWSTGFRMTLTLKHGG